VAVSLAQVLFGEGISYFGTLKRGHLRLADPEVVQGRRAVHLRFKVPRPDPATHDEEAAP
jgi:hypothetical protein